MGAYRTVLDHIFRQMDRLDALDITDAEAVSRETARSSAIGEMASTVVKVSQEMRSANREMADLYGLDRAGGEMGMLLEGDGDGR